MVNIGEKIKQLRKAKKISQEKLAEELEVSIQQIHKYETGKNRIPIEKLIMLANKFDVELNYFSDTNFKQKRNNTEFTLALEEQELIQIYRNIQREEFKRSWIIIGIELSKFRNSE